MCVKTNLLMCILICIEKYSLFVFIKVSNGGDVKVNNKCYISFTFNILIEQKL